MKHWHLVTRNCEVCLRPLIPVEPGQDVHPGCDRSGRVWWSEEERAAWLAARQPEEQQ